MGLSFGYTHCADVCPITLAALAQVRARLGKPAARMRVVFVTVDPERDTPDRLQAYTQAFDPAFVPLTGTPRELAQVRHAYGVIAGRRGGHGQAPAYLVDHGASVFVVDLDGRLRLMFIPGTAVADMIHDVSLLLEAPAR